VTLETVAVVGGSSSIAIGVDGNPVIAYTDATRDAWELDGCEDPACGGDLALYVCDDPACSSGTNVTLETTGDVGWDTSIAIGVDGNPVISHYDATNEDLELYVCDDPACSSGANVTLETDGNVGFRGSLVIGVTGNPVISHMDRANEDLELYVCDDPACSSGANVTLETIGSVGWDPAVTISDNGNPVISHGRWDWDEVDGDLELYVCDNPACSSGTNVTLVTTGSVGVFSSITIGDDGNPVIAHQEYAKGDLEFAQVMMPVSVVAYQ
jgi:fructose-specific phosphotransferase system component IIB